MGWQYRKDNPNNFIIEFRDYSINMILGILLCALVICGANSSLTTDTDLFEIIFPSLNQANTEDLAEGLKYIEFTSVDFINARYLSTRL